MSKIEARAFPKTKNPKHSEKNYTKLIEARIIQKNLVYVIGLSSSLANKEVMPNLYRFSQNKNISGNTGISLK